MHWWVLLQFPWRAEGLGEQTRRSEQFAGLVTNGSTGCPHSVHTPHYPGSRFPPIITISCM